MALLDRVTYYIRLIYLACQLQYTSGSTATPAIAGAATPAPLLSKRVRLTPAAVFQHPLPLLPLLLHLFPHRSERAAGVTAGASGAAGGALSAALPDTAAHVFVPQHHYFSTDAAYFSYVATQKAIPLVCDRVSLPSSRVTTVPLHTILPPTLVHYYTTPGLLLRTPADLRSKPPLSKAPRAFCSSSEYVKLVRRMHSVGMLGLLRADQMRCINGCFGVPKDSDTNAGEIRMIIDAVNANSYFVDPPHTALPSPSHLAQLVLPAGATLYVGKCDLSNFYHHIPLPDWLQPYFCLPPVGMRQLGLGTSDGAELVFPCCLTMPMWFKHAVFMAQAIHEHILYTVPPRLKPSLFPSAGAIAGAPLAAPPCSFSSRALLSLQPRCNILSVGTPYLDTSTVLHAIYIDDAGILSLDQQLGEEVFELVLYCYQLAGFLVKQSKVVRPTAGGVVLFGVYLYGYAPTPCIRAPVHKLLLQLQTIAVLVRGCCSGDELAALVGSWTWFMLLRRPALSLFRTVYRFTRTAGARVFMLWPSVVRELFAVLQAAPLLCVDLTTAYFHRTVATDASCAGAGVTAAPLTPALLQHLSSLLVTPDHVYTIDPSVAGADSDTPVAAADPIQQPALVLAPVRPSHVTVKHLRALTGAGARWYTVSSYPWTFPEHINTLELRALFTALQWVVGHRTGTNARVLLWVDNTTVAHVMRKGRSSANTIAPVLRRVAACLLAANLVPNTCWLPTAFNPADEPSRVWTALCSLTTGTHMHDGRTAHSLPP